MMTFLNSLLFVLLWPLLVSLTPIVLLYALGVKILHAVDKKWKSSVTVMWIKD